MTATVSAEQKAKAIQYAQQLRDKMKYDSTAPLFADPRTCCSPSNTDAFLCFLWRRRRRWWWGIVV